MFYKKNYKNNTDNTTVLQTKMFSIVILVGLCPRGWIVTLSLMLDHIRQVWKITIFKPKLCQHCGIHCLHAIQPLKSLETLFSVHMSMPTQFTIPVAMPSATNYAYTITVTTKTTIVLLIPIIPVQQQIKNNNTLKQLSLQQTPIRLPLQPSRN